MSKLTVAIEATRLEAEDDRPLVGAWFWVKHDDDVDEEYDSDDDERVREPKYDRGRGKSAQWLGCITEVGSNYAKLKGVRYSRRIALDDLHKECTPEPEPEKFIDEKVNGHRDKVRALMGEIKRVCHQLGVPFHQALTEAEAPSQALAVAHGTSDVNAYGKALVQAKDKTLPELFAKVKKQHEHMATWMKAELIPAQAELDRAKGITEVINGKIHTVELYAGLQEKLVQVREGEPAKVDAKVHIMQRRCYMDEECLARYEAGGMDFENIEAFDKWLARDENMTRILPHERCIVAFRVRRYSKDYAIGDSLSRFIRFQFHNDYNKWTFLYIRNGRQLWRMHTSIDFEHELFPRREDSELIGDDELWVNPGCEGHSDQFISGQQRASRIESWKERRREYAAKLWAWKRAGKPDEDTYWRCNPSASREEQANPWKASDCHSWPTGVSLSERELGRPYGSDNIKASWQRYERVTPENIYYDDAMKHIASVSLEHNRIAVIMQGLLDRSTCLHPHPPWRIWTPEGFAEGIELVYDVSLAVTSGPQPDWHGYRAQLNKSIRVGAFVIGQVKPWREEMEELYGEYWKVRDKVGNGPKRIDRVRALRGGKARFEWERESRRGSWVPNPERPGWMKRHYKTLDQHWWCPLEELTCIDAYTPGDFRMFFDDPRTRANYIQWAPILLSAEDWHAKRRDSKDETEMEGDDD